MKFFLTACSIRLRHVLHVLPVVAVVSLAHSTLAADTPRKMVVGASSSTVSNDGLIDTNLARCDGHSKLPGQFGVAKFGAGKTAGGDDTDAFQATEESAHTTNRGQQTIWLEPGSYKLSKTVFNPSGSLWIIPPGSSLTGGALQGNNDGSTILPGHEGLALVAIMKAAGGSGLFVSNTAIAPTSFRDYEADGIYASVSTSDPSIKAYHDVVAGHFSSLINVANRVGRAWGQDVSVEVPNGADGYAVGQEVVVTNNSGTTGNYGETNAKIGIHLLAAGKSNSTTGLLIHDAGSAFHDGIEIFRSAITNAALRVVSSGTDIAAIYANGNALLGTTTFSGSIKLVSVPLNSLPMSCVGGQEVYVSDGRNPGERVGAGTGTPAFCNSQQKWFGVNSGKVVEH